MNHNYFIEKFNYQASLVAWVVVAQLTSKYGLIENLSDLLSGYPNYFFEPIFTPSLTSLGFAVAAGFLTPKSAFPNLIKRIKDKCLPASKANGDDEKYPFYVLEKSGVYIAVNLLEDSSGEEIKQLLDNDFLIISDDCMANTSQGAIDQVTVSFTWWKVWGTLGLISSFLYLIFTLVEEEYFVTFLMIVSILGAYLVLKMNKYAFLFMTVFSLNPLIWIVNGIYLKNRWHHPKINK